jgi:hypothetical protein
MGTRTRPHIVPGDTPDDGRCWRSRVSEHLRAAGRNNAAAVAAFCSATGITFPDFIRIEAGLLEPSADYRARANAALGVDAFEHC